MWPKEKVFQEIHRIETEHKWLKGKHIRGIADPAIFAADGGESIAETAEHFQVYFEPGDHQRIPGWMQVHYRLSFNAHGIPRMYIFKNCSAFIRTVPALVFDDYKVEDLNTDGEDHVADEVRYFCMARPVKAIEPVMQDHWNETGAHLFLDINKEDLVPYKQRPRMEVREIGESE